MKIKLDKNMITGITISLASCFLLFIYAPLELYFSNKGEFWFDIYLLLPVMLVIFILAFTLNFLCFFFLDKINFKFCQIFSIFYFIVFICTYVQGNFLNSNLPPLDGTAIQWDQYSGERFKTIILWFIVIAGILILLKFFHMDKLQGLIRFIGICMTLMLLTTLISLCITTKGYERKPNLAISTKNQFEMSKNQNFIIFLLDAADSGTFSKLMENHPEYKDIFGDFTYYKNTTGVYSFTKHSIPFILSGDWYENDETYDKYITNAYINSPFFSELERQSYRLGIYEAEMLPMNEDFLRFENVLPNSHGVTSWTDFARWQIQMVGFKYAPFDLKKICFINPNAFKNLKIPPEGYSVFTDSNVSFYERTQSEKVTLTQDKCFKFIHISGAHLPFQYDANVNIIENATYETNFEASMTITKAYLNKLKENDVYDNSVIIVMADHGYSMDGELWRQNPIFFVKGIGEKHEMKTSNAPVSFVDLQDAYKRLLDGAGSEAIFDCQEGDQRERRYLFYYYNDESPMYEYMQSGMAWERDTFKPTGREYVLKE